MTSLPPEVARARELLRRVAPQPGSRERVYSRVIARPRRRSPLGGRFAIIACCLCLSATAMGLGYKWVARDTQPKSPAITVLTSTQIEARVPRKQNIKNIPSEDVGTAKQNVSRVDQNDSPPAPKTFPVPAAVASDSSEPEALPKSIASLPDLPELSPQPEPPIIASELRQQVSDYRNAVAYLRDNPAVGLQWLTAHRARWPNSAIAHEVDLRIIEALVSLGRQGEARVAARRFLQRYPDSARAAEVRRIAESTPSADPVVE